MKLLEGCWTREDTKDFVTVEEIFKNKVYKNLLPMNEDVILDLGGHIGVFAVWAKANGAKEVYSFEPDNSNYKVLIENSEPRYARFGAIVSNHVGNEITFYKTPAKTENKVWGTLIKKPRSKDSITVPAYDFGAVLKERDFTIIKCDIEGGEYLLDWNQLTFAKTVKKIMLEYHFFQDGFRDKFKEIDHILNYYEFKTQSDIEKIYSKKGVWPRNVYYQR